MAVRLLIVDDSASFRAVVRVAAEMQGFDVCGEAEDGRDAISKARALRPTAILLDWQMPRLSGMEALPELVDMLPDAVIVMYSSTYSERATAAAMSAGARAYFVKGIDEVDGVLHTVRDFVEEAAAS